MSVIKFIVSFITYSIIYFIGLAIIYIFNIDLITAVYSIGTIIGIIGASIFRFIDDFNLL